MQRITRRKWIIFASTVVSLFLAKILFFPRLFNEKKESPDSSKQKGDTMKAKPNPKVVRVHSNKLSNWDAKRLNYIESVDQNTVNGVMNEAICRLTDQGTPDTAWKQVFISYKPGDKVAIHPNFNPADKPANIFFNDIIPSPQIINYIVASLNSHLNVSFNDIYVYELTRPIPQELIRKYIAYPVQYVEIPGSSFVEKVKNKLRIGLAAPDFNEPIEMREEITDAKGNKIDCYLPKVVTQCQHLINLSVFKYHQFHLLSGLLKNHYGTVRFSNLSHYPSILHENKLYKSVVDLNRNPFLHSITRLHVVDAIFGAYDYQPLTPVKKPWKTLGTDGFPKSIFVGQDPVAIESVLHDHLVTERKVNNLPISEPDYLKDAAKHNVGIFESNPNMEYFRIDYRQLELT